MFGKSPRVFLATSPICPDNPMLRTDRTLSPGSLLSPLPPSCVSSSLFYLSQHLSSTLSLGHLTHCSEESHMETLARTFRSAQEP